MNRILSPEEWKFLKRLFHAMSLSEFVAYLRREGYTEDEINEILNKLSPSKPLILPEPTSDPKPDYVPDPCD